MGSDDRIKQFKDIAKNYERYMSHIKGLDDKIHMIQHKMENVHSIEFDKPTGSSSAQERPMIELIEKKAALEKEQKYYKDLISWTEGIVDSFDSGAIKALIWMSCVKRRSLGSIADEYNMSRDYLYKIRRAWLVRALDDEAMNNLDHIQQSAPIQINDTSADTEA